MKRIYTALILAVCFFQVTCKNPLTGIKLYVRNDYYKYTVTLTIKDATSPTTNLDNAKISVSGSDGTSIYDKDGTQNFSVVNGEVDFSVIPTKAPTTTSPVVFTVNISIPGSTPKYIPVSKIITITPDQVIQRYTVRLINAAGGSTGGVDVGSRSISLSSGGLSKPGYSGARTTYSDGALDALGDSIALYIPGGLNFYYYQNSAGKPMGTQPSILTHDSTITLGANPVLYRPTANYYDVENALIPSSFSKVNYTGTSLTAYFIYQPSTAPGYSIYNYGTTYNLISTLMNPSPALAENSILLSTVALKRLVAIYFVAELSDGQYIIVSPSQKTASTAIPDTNNWFLSYKVNPSIINPMTGVRYKNGDLVESGIHYTSSGLSSSYPILPLGTIFTPSTLNTVHQKVRKTADSVLRVECQSVDVGLYVPGFIKSYSFTLNTQNDTNIIPDPENLYANATINFSLGTSSFYYNYIVYPVNPPGISTINLSGTVLFSITSTSAPTITGSYSVYYWDSVVASSQPLTSSGTANVFTGTLSNPKALYPDIIRFYYTFTCAASGTAKIIEPTFNGSISGKSASGQVYTTNCNVKNGYWATRGFRYHQTSDPLVARECGKVISFPAVSLTKFNYGNIENDDICKCLFH